MRGTDYEFLPTNTQAIIDSLTEKYEEVSGYTVSPASPEKLFINWIADIIVQERVNINYAANQNIPSRAVGENLDALGEWMLGLPRRPAQSAKCTVRFAIYEPQNSAVLIPLGTRVTDLQAAVAWETTADALIEIGDTSVDVMCECQTAGVIGNGYEAGQINTLVDVDNILYFSSCANIAVSDGGAEEEDDETYYERIRGVLDSYSTAGAQGSYEYWAKSVSDEIGDVRAVRPSELVQKTLSVKADSDGNLYAILGGDLIDADTVVVKADEDDETPAELTTDYTVSYADGVLLIGITSGGALDALESIYVEVAKSTAGHVHLYVLMKDGSLATDTIKSAVYAACNSRDVRPLTDYVEVHDLDSVSFDIEFTYYIPNDSEIPITDIQTAITNAVNEYKDWQCSRIGRDINPAKLLYLLMQTGVKRVELTSPTFRVLRSGSDGYAPQIACVGTVTATNGGYEDE